MSEVKKVEISEILEAEWRICYKKYMKTIIDFLHATRKLEEMIKNGAFEP